MCGERRYQPHEHCRVTNRPLTRAQLNRLKKHATLEPASEAGLLWTLVWAFVSIALFRIFAEQTFPQYGDAQCVSLPWVGALLLMGGLIAAALCYLLYRYRSYCKRIAIARLRQLVREHDARATAPEQPARSP